MKLCTTGTLKLRQQQISCGLRILYHKLKQWCERYGAVPALACISLGWLLRVDVSGLYATVRDHPAPLQRSPLHRSSLPQTTLHSLYQNSTINTNCLADPLSTLSSTASHLLISVMRRFLVSVTRPALQSRPVTSFSSSLRPFATASTSGKTGKTNAPSTEDGDASRRTGDYGPADSAAKPLEQEGQGGKGGATGGNVGQRSESGSKSSSATKKAPGGDQPKRTFATSSSSNKNTATQSSTTSSTAQQSAPEGKQASQADAAAKAKAGKDATHSSPTPTPHEAQHRKASGKSAVSGSSASAEHRKQEEYTKHRDLATGAEASVAADRAAHDPLPDKLKHSTKVNKEQ